MKTADTIYDQLPETFTRMDVKKLMYKHGFSPASHQPVLEELSIKGQVQRIAHGKYAKVDA